jgi:hypothetical protein
VLDEEQNVSGRLAPLALDELFLQREGSEIIHPAKIFEEQHSDP